MRSVICKVRVYPPERYAISYLPWPRFGHQDAITGLDALSRERAVTCGGRDTSCRVWKLVEESQLVFSGHRDSIDCIRLINEEHWVTGGQDGYGTQTR